MAITVIVGGQYGSEGKGKVALALARQQQASIVVRVGGSNSGHTAVDASGASRIFRHLPTAALSPDVLCVLAAGSYIDADILLEEIASVGLHAERLAIDPNAVLVTEEERREEARHGLKERIGSTGSGTGAAVLRRTARDGSAKFVGDDPRLRAYVRPTRPLIRSSLNADKRVIIEGTQGFGLSLLHSHEYPHTTSRDTTAACFLAETGASPLDVDRVVLVIRSYPIRVSSPQAGYLPREIDWDVVTKEAGSPVPLIEWTSVTRAVRRVARFDAEIVRAAIQANRPTDIVLNHLDYVDSTCAPDSGLTDKARIFIRTVESEIGTRLTHFGFGPASFIERTNVL